MIPLSERQKTNLLPFLEQQRQARASVSAARANAELADRLVAHACELVTPDGYRLDLGAGMLVPLDAPAPEGGEG